MHEGDELCGKPEGMGPVFCPRWEDKIKVGIRGTGYEVVDWIQLDHYRSSDELL
jgi:hypothetical protein